MEFSEIELLVLDTLRRAASQNVEILEPAGTQLKKWETEPGFYSILLKIISNHSIEANVRWSAVTFFKNGVDCYWRKNAPNAISEEEKASLRTGLMGTFTEPVNQVAIQLAVLISKAARYDCPREWPQLVPNLVQLSMNDDLVVQHRGLLSLYHVIKTLSSKRLLGDRKIFEELAGEIFPVISTLWNSHFENFFHQVQNNDPQYQGTLEKALLSLKILSKLTMYGFKEHHKVPCVVAFLTEIFHRVPRMLLFRKTIESKSESLRQLTERTIVHSVKVLLSLLHDFPLSYIDFVEPSVGFSIMYLFTDQGDSLLFERFTVLCMKLLREIISCSKYKVSKFTEDPKETENLGPQHIKSEFFQANTLAEIFKKLITHYFVLTREELQLWDSDPENFDRTTFDETEGSWEDSLRACTSSLFLALFRKYRESLSPVLLELIRNNHHLVDPQDIDAIIRKDAVYNAVGLAASELYDEVDFDQWFSTTLIQELSIKEPNYRVIRRRVAWLLGQWTGIKFSPELRPALYGALITLLCAEEDLAVRLSAAVALKRVMDDFHFNSEQFTEFLEPAFSLLFVLLQEVEECDTKLQILYVLSYIVERMGLAIKPYSQSLFGYLPLLWEESVKHNMLRCAIVYTLVRGIRGLVTENLTSFLFPVIELSIDLNQDAHVYLLEDGLDLWYALLDNSPSLSPQLLQLYKGMPSVLEYTHEHLKCCGSIIQAYILLGPQEFLTEYGDSVISSCLNLLKDVHNDGMIMIMQVIETAIRANTYLAINLSMPVLPTVLLNIWREKSFLRLMTMYLSVICRILLYSKDIFSQILGNAARDKSETSEQFLEKVLTVWLRTMPLVAPKEERKLLALALASLLTSGSNIVMSLFRGIIRNIVEVLNDIVDVDDYQVQVDSLMVTEEFISSDECDIQEETENDKRKRQLMRIDPIYNMELKNYLQSQINELKSKVSVITFEGLINSLDSEIVEQLRLYVTI